jgi:hypothetical protein
MDTAANNSPLRAQAQTDTQGGGQRAEHGSIGARPTAYIQTLITAVRAVVMNRARCRACGGIFPFEDLPELLMHRFVT